jgi:hypothetical protein
MSTDEKNRLRELCADAAFIAATRNAVPTLLDEVERLEGLWETPGKTTLETHLNCRYRAHSGRTV